MGSPPLSPVAKSAHLPARRLIENDPALRSSRTGFRATHSHPPRRPSGSQRPLSGSLERNQSLADTELTGVLLVNASRLLQDAIQVSDQPGYPLHHHLASSALVKTNSATFRRSIRSASFMNVWILSAGCFALLALLFAAVPSD